MITATKREYLARITATLREETTPILSGLVCRLYDGAQLVACRATWVADNGTVSHRYSVSP